MHGDLGMGPSSGCKFTLFAAQPSVCPVLGDPLLFWPGLVPSPAVFTRTRPHFLTLFLFLSQSFPQISTAAIASYHSSLPVKLQWCLLETGRKEKLESIPASNEIHTHTGNLVAETSHPAEGIPMASSLHRRELHRDLLLTLYLV